MYLIEFVSDIKGTAVESGGEEPHEILIRGQEQRTEGQLGEDDQSVQQEASEVAVEDMRQQLQPDLRLMATGDEEQIPGELTHVAVVTFVMDPCVDQRDDLVRRTDCRSLWEHRRCTRPCGVGEEVVLECRGQGLLRAGDPQFL